MNGFIKLDRCLLTKKIFHNDKLLKTWIWCLLKATHTERKEMIGRQEIVIYPGQFITGRFAAGIELGMPPSTVWSYIKFLEKNQSINIKSNNKFSIIAIVNWEFYQIEKYKSDTNSDNKRTANRQQMDTNKNDKKDKNNNPPIVPPKEKIKLAEYVTMTNDEYGKLLATYGKEMTARMIEILDNYKGANGKKYRSDYRAILNWVVERCQEEQQRHNKGKPPNKSEPEKYENFYL